MTDPETFTDPPRPAPSDPPPGRPGLLTYIVVYEVVAVVTWVILATGGAARLDPLGLPAMAAVVGVFAWMSWREW